MLSAQTDLIVNRREKLRMLFLHNPYKSFQLRYQSLDPEELFPIWIHELQFRDFVVFQEEQHFLGCVTVQKLRDFSDFLCMQVASIRDFLFTPAVKQSFIDTLLQQSIHDANLSGTQILIARLPLGNVRAITSLLANGFYFVCGESTLTCNLFQHQSTGLLKSHSHVRAATLEDLDQVQELSVVAHQEIRYLSDANFDAVRVKSFYSMLPQRALISNANRQLLVYEDRGKIVGYISFGINTRLHTLPLRYASLDYIAVHPSVQGQGVGHALNSHALSELHQRGVHAVCVRTMASNYPAISVLLKNAFRVTDQNMILHRVRT